MSSKSKNEEQKVLKTPAPSEKKYSLKESIANLDSIITFERAKGTPEGNRAADQAERVRGAFQKMLGKK